MTQHNVDALHVILSDISSSSPFSDDDKLNDAVAADSISAYADVKSTTNFQATLKRGSLTRQRTRITVAGDKDDLRLDTDSLVIV
jgi:hypothetical protein